MEILSDIKSFNSWKEIKRIEKGWSQDTKYHIKDNYNEEFLLRLSDISAFKQKQKEFDMLKEVYELEINMSYPIEFGICNNGKNTYMLLSWIKGTPLNETLNSLTKEAQYKLGVEAGQILKKMHTICPKEPLLDYESNLHNKILQRISFYEEKKLHVPNDDSALAFIRNNISKISDLKINFQHGDFHVGNLIYCPNKQIGVIDFNRWGFGDNYEEFYKLQSFSREISIPFSVGQINSYFDGAVPQKFWEVLAIYNAYVALYSIIWAIPFGEDEIVGMVKRAETTFVDYNNFNSIIPQWYVEYKKIAFGN